MSNQTTAFALISRREKEVLQLVAEGLTSKHIASQLFLSTRTVENHRVNLLRKFSARNTTTLLRRAREENLI